MTVLEREREYDRQLPTGWLVRGPGDRLLEAGRAWSEAVWAAATAAGPIDPSAAEIDRAFELAWRPVFICGVHRSGTTLIRDLVDAHSSLSVLPSEGTFFTNLKAQLDRRKRAERLPFYTQEWLRRLANPINRPPYWVIGRSSEAESPYVTFARTLMGYWPVVLEHASRRITSWPLLSLALAYAAVTGGGTIAPDVVRWVEKTPTNERFLEKLWAEYPAAKVIHVLRDPTAVVASRKRLEQQATGVFSGAAAVLADLAASYRAARRDRDRARYCLVRYEDLLAAPESEMRRLASFLRIDFQSTLLTPTVAGIPTASNTAFDPKVPPGRIGPAAGRPPEEFLTRAERAQIAAALGDDASAAGYAPPRIGRWRARLVRIALHYD